MELPVNFLSLGMGSISFSSSYSLLLLLLFICVGPTCLIFFHFLVCFSSEINHFVPISILFIIIEYSLHIYHFSRFFSNPVFNSLYTRRLEIHKIFRLS